MSVTITAPTGKRTRVLNRGNLGADGTEQLLTEFEGGGKVSGNVDLHEMAAGDKIIVRQYFKMDDYQKYAEEAYEGFQDSPLVYFPERTTDVAIKITLEQTEGVYRRFRHSFMVED